MSCRWSGRCRCMEQSHPNLLAIGEQSGVIDVVLELEIEAHAFIQQFIPPRIAELVAPVTQFRQAAGFLAPVGHHLHKQLQVHRSIDQLLHLQPRARADLFEH